MLYNSWLVLVMLSVAIVLTTSLASLTTSASFFVATCRSIGSRQRFVISIFCIIFCLSSICLGLSDLEDVAGVHCECGSLNGSCCTVSWGSSISLIMLM